MTATTTRAANPAQSARAYMPRATAPQDIPAGADLGHPSLYFNQELGWLAGEAPLDFHEALMRDALERALRSSGPASDRGGGQ